ncbi:DUF4293 domain-containing protein [Parabacteroides sp. OttesenSCG-928-N08]|nr:DUF4293 domain-containing protein [Parabacteroides sp. OttesenSCG-928-N08]
MLQRIQTVYLLIIVALTVAMLFLPLITIQSGEQFFTLDVTGFNTTIEQPQLLVATWGLFALTAIIALIALITIFLYKNRVLQMRLSIFNALLMVGFYALVAFFVWKFKEGMEIDAFNVKLALCFPLISLILDYLAIRNIGADEALVRSLNRLR